jgi:hypothetical protein
LFLIGQVFDARLRGQLAALPLALKPAFPALRHAPFPPADGNPVVGSLTAFRPKETCPAQPAN